MRGRGRDYRKKHLASKTVCSYKFRLEDVEQPRQMVELSWNVPEVCDTEVHSHPPTLTRPHIHLSPRLMQLHKHWSGAGK